MARTALLAGATGLVGRQLLQQLLQHPEYQSITVLARRPLDHEEGKLSTLLTDFSDLSDQATVLAVDDVYCALGTTIRSAGSRAAFERVDYHMVVDLARAARRAGAKRFIVVSAAGSSEKSLAFYSRVKARMEKAVADLGFEAVHILRPSLLLGDRDEFRPAEKIGQLLAPLLRPLMLGPLRPYQPISAAEVASTMLDCALQGPAGTHYWSLPRPRKA